MDESKKISIAHCRSVLQLYGKSYTDEQIKKIRDILYILGELEYLIFKEAEKKELS